MSSIDQLEKETTEFFNKYWNPVNGDYPKWSDVWHFTGTIPNQDKQGCYALLSDNEIIYIGVGIGKGSGIYINCGLGYRLKRYWQVDKSENATRQYTSRVDWGEIDGIITIGFDPSYYALAAALEIFLINQLTPKRNKLHR